MVYGISGNSSFGFLAKAFCATDVTASPKFLAEKSQVLTTASLRDEYVSSETGSSEAATDDDRETAAQSKGAETGSRPGKIASPSKPTVSFSSMLPGMQQKQAGMLGGLINETIQGLSRKAFERHITHTLDQHGVQLHKGDYLACSLDGNAKFSMSLQNSRVSSFKNDDEALARALEKVTTDLNNDTVDGVSFGELMLQTLADEMGIDLEEARKDESFRISFIIAYDDKIGENVIMGVRAEMGEDLFALAEKITAYHEKKAHEKQQERAEEEKESAVDESPVSEAALVETPDVETTTPVSVPIMEAEAEIVSEAVLPATTP